MQVLAFVAGLVLILTASCCAENANYSCFNLTSPEAENIQKVYDDNQDSGVFWYRSASGLGSCDFSSIYSTPQCSVCNDSGTIIVVLYNLTISVKLKVEGPEGPISYNKINCPQPPTPDDKPGEQRGWTRIWVSLAFIAAFIIFIIIIIIIIIIIKNLRKRKSQKAPINAEGSPDPL